MDMAMFKPMVIIRHALQAGRRLYSPDSLRLHHIRGVGRPACLELAEDRVGAYSCRGMGRVD